MRFAPPPKRKAHESVVPMINVVFLLLIFFMMSARIAPAPPFDLNLPEGAQDQTLAEAQTLYISADGVAGFAGAVGERAWDGFAAAAGDEVLTVRADAALEARLMAQILARLARMGQERIELAVGTP